MVSNLSYTIVLYPRLVYATFSISRVSICPPLACSPHSNKANLSHPSLSSLDLFLFPTQKNKRPALCRTARRTQPCTRQGCPYPHWRRNEASAISLVLFEWRNERSVGGCLGGAGRRGTFKDGGEVLMRWWGREGERWDGKGWVGMGREGKGREGMV